MRLLNITVRNILTLGIIIVLTAAMIWLVRGQTQPQTGQAEPTVASTVTSSSTDTSTSIIETPPMPITASPVATQPYLIFQTTPIPGPTYTPTPAEANLSSLSQLELSFGSPNPLLPANDIHALENFSLDRPVWSTDGQSLLFEKQIGYTPVDQATLIPQVDLWTLNIGTGKVMLLAEGTDRGIWSPDNQKIAYIANASTGNPKVMVLDVKELSKDLIDTEVAWRTPIWLNHNTLLYADVEGNLWQTDIGIKAHLPFYSQKIPSEVIQNLAVAFVLSPNADYLLIAGHNSFTLTHLTTGNNITLQDIQPDEKFLNIVGGVAWSPSGHEIVYTSYNAAGQWINIFNASTSQYTHRISIDLTKFDLPRSFSWSPGNRFLAFSARQSETGTTTDIFVLDINSEKIVNITNTAEFYEDSPAWSPDNSLITYLRYTEGLPSQLWSIEIH